jgi:cholesterol transport system auxiliary component
MKAILIILTILFSGCTTIKPPVTEYSVVTKDLKKESVSSGCRDKSLKIAQAFSSNSLMSLNMEYTQDLNRVFSYSQAQWRESPNSLVTSELLKNIGNSKLFGSVHPSKSRVKSDLILETNIEEFMQFYTQDMKKSFVHVGFSLTLIDAKSNSVIKSQYFSSKFDATTLDAQGGVEATQNALSEIIFQNIDWLGGVCK